ncbi:MAG: hypothetical protein WC823_07070 [Parcubacteria group bacterium]|jgi:hypothetical protein
MKKHTLLLAVFSAVAFVGATGAQAVMPSEEVRAQREQLQADRREDQAAMQAEKKASMDQRKEETKEQRCARIQERIQARIQMRENNSNGDGKKHTVVYKNMVSRITKFIERLSAEGYDTAKVQADLGVLEEKIQKFSADREVNIAKLGEAKKYVCEKADEDFKAKLAEVRKNAQLTQMDAMDIRKYMLNTVRPDIQALRNQKVATKKVTDTANASTPELE